MSHLLTLKDQGELTLRSQTQIINVKMNVVTCPGIRDSHYSQSTVGPCPP